MPRKAPQGKRLNGARNERPEAIGLRAVSSRAPRCCEPPVASVTDAGAAYELEVYGAVAVGCSCLAGMNDDPVCKHRAAYYLLVAALDLDLGPPTPAAPAAPVACAACRGDGRVWGGTRAWSRGVADGWWSRCDACDGTGEAHERLAA